MRYLFSTVALLFLAAVASAAEPALAEKEWTVDGVARKGLVHVPMTGRTEPAPVVFVFHGHGGTMAHAARTMAFHVQWPEAIVVYLQGLNTPGKLTDLEGKRPGWQPGRGDQDDRDLKLFDTVFKSLKSDFKVDESRVYATGHSNGGSFTYLLWATRGDVFAAMAPSAAVPGREIRNLSPKPALHVAGENDPLVKWEWQKLTMDALRKLNGCEAQGKEWASSGNLKGTLYPSSKETPVVTLISPGDHKFPSEAPALIVKFFKEHAKK